MHITSIEECSLAGCRIIHSLAGCGHPNTHSPGAPTHVLGCVSYDCVWILKKFTNFAFLWLSLKFSSDMLSRNQFHQSGGSSTGIELHRLWGYVSLSLLIS